MTRRKDGELSRELYNESYPSRWLILLHMPLLLLVSLSSRMSTCDVILSFSSHPHFITLHALPHNRSEGMQNTTIISTHAGGWIITVF